MKRVIVKKEDKEKIYYIGYSFNGYGGIYVEAPSEERAKEMFYNGECDFDDEGDNYAIEEIREE